MDPCETLAAQPKHEKTRVDPSKPKITNKHDKIPFIIRLGWHWSLVDPILWRGFGLPEPFAMVPS
jgi:hypothetical protein